MRLRLNGRVSDEGSAPHETLLEVLRRAFPPAGAWPACDVGECDACIVLLAAPGDVPRPAYACLTLAAACADADITVTNHPPS